MALLLAKLKNTPFRGEVDFLLKINNKSKLGNYSYEVYDTKVTCFMKMTSDFLNSFQILFKTLF